MSPPRVALVTGAARGIGAETVERLSMAGWAVLAVDAAADNPAVGYPMSSVADLDEAVAAARVGGGDVQPYMADVRDVGVLGAAVAEAERRWGGLDVAIACAGVIGGGQPHWESSAQTERAIVEVNLVGVLNLARVCVPALLRRPRPRSGRFVAVASAGASRGLPMLASYCAAKAGVAGFIRSLAVELGDSGVTANAVSPGSTDTAMLAESARLYGLDSPADFAAHAAQRRLLSVAEVVSVIAFLAGPSSSAMTGAIVPADAGLGL